MYQIKDTWQTRNMAQMNLFCLVFWIQLRYDKSVLSCVARPWKNHQNIWVDARSHPVVIGCVTGCTGGNSNRNMIVVSLFSVI